MTGSADRRLQEDHPWARVGTPGPEALAEAVRELHWAVRLVASAGHTFAQPAPDDSHTAMVWDPALQALVGAPFAGAYPFRVALRPADLSLLFLDRTGGALGTLPLAGVNRADARAWIALAMATYLGGPPPALEEPDHEIPEHPVEHGAPFSAEPGDEYAALAALYATASDLLEEVVADQEDVSPVRCWPHHFDLAALITVKRDETGEATHTVGLGFAPMGGGFDEWYWYVSPWPSPAEERLDTLDRGSWHTEEWTGAVLPGREVVALPAGERQEAVRLFLRAAVVAARRALEDQD